MPGIQNSKKNGMYAFIHPVIINGTVTMAGTIASQQLILANAQTTLENAGLDTTQTTHPLTLSTPVAPSVITGTVCGLAKAVSGYSKTLMINGHSALQNGTQKLQNTGNCPTSPMVKATQAKTYVYVAS